MKRVNCLFANAASILAMVVVVSVMVTITARGIGAPIVWGDDISQIAFVYLFFFALSPALESGHHVSVDIFEPMVPKKLRRLLGVIAACAIILFCIIFIIQLWRLTGRSLGDGRLARTVLPVELGWLQIAGPIGVGQMALTALAQLISEIRILRNPINQQT